MSSTGLGLVTPVSASLTLTVPRRSAMNMSPFGANSMAVGAVRPVATCWASKPVGTWMPTAVPPKFSLRSSEGCPVTKASSNRASCSADSWLLTSARNDSQALAIPPGMGRSGPTSISVLPGFMLVLKLTLYIPPGCGLTIR